MIKRVRWFQDLQTLAGDTKILQKAVKEVRRGGPRSGSQSLLPFDEEEYLSIKDFLEAVSPASSNNETEVAADEEGFSPDVCGVCTLESMDTDFEPSDDDWAVYGSKADTQMAVLDLEAHIQSLSLEVPSEQPEEFMPSEDDLHYLDSFGHGESSGHSQAISSEP